jgi:hypothetical protein
MEYDESIGLVIGKMNFFMTDFHVLVLLWQKTAIKKIPSVTRRCRYRCDCRSQKFVPHVQPLPYKLEC